MPEATVLYSVTGVVILGLVIWVAMVLKQAKEPWARPAPAGVPAETPADELDAPEQKEALSAPSSGLNADETARATPVALSEGRQKAASVTDEAPLADDKKSEP